jgi:hypothetical protein
VFSGALEHHFPRQNQAGVESADDPLTLVSVVRVRRTYVSLRPAYQKLLRSPLTDCQLHGRGGSEESTGKEIVVYWAYTEAGFLRSGQKALRNRVSAMR